MGSADNPRCDMMQGGRKGLAPSPSLAWLLACVSTNHMILLIVADH